MFVLNTPVTVVASSVRKPYTPKQGSKGLILRSSIPILTNSINGLTLPHPILISTASALFTRFGFEGTNERAERRDFFNVFPLISPFSQKALEDFIYNQFPKLCNVVNIKAIRDLTIHHSLKILPVQAKFDEFITVPDNNWLCVLCLNRERTKIDNSKVLLKNTIKAFQDMPEQERDMLAKEPLLTSLLNNNKFRRIFFKKSDYPLQVEFSRRILSAYLRNRTMIYTQDVERDLRMLVDHPLVKQLHSEHRALYLNPCLRLSVLTGKMFLSDRPLKGKFSPQITSDILDANASLIGLESLNTSPTQSQKEARS